jgi:gluconolactonase
LPPAPDCGGDRGVAKTRQEADMPLQPIPVSAFTKIAVGVDRPEDVVVGADGRVFASDHRCAVAEIFADGSFKRLGPPLGAPNGVNMDRQGRIIIANFGIYDGQAGPLERFDPASGVRETLLAEVGGRTLTSANYPVIDRAGNIWCANSTHAETWPQALDGRADGFLFVLRPDGSSQIVAEGLKFPNGLALDAGETALYCAQTSGADVLRFPILPGARLGPGERYGPVLGKLQSPGEPLHDTGDLGYTDGIGFDAEGNLWVCLPAANKVVAIAPDGGVATVIHDPTGSVVNHPTNVTWGGADLRDLYIGSIRADYVLKARSPLPGQPQIHQKA